MTKFIASLLSLGFMATAAIAASEIDTNGDGMMTIDEVQAVFPDVSAEAFAEADTNDDGALDDAEMVAGQEQGLLPVAADG
ncbi:EF-hand domain-containing protein [Roseovarius faecimaris]|uniref:EF-hand domain-containing protein n=1 Tax=Roseovarius faecimaris TaxID=2494550 RepID=A0A6I6IPB2_9RHOB|nr:EF-hand domain-containing protein [Roseovarius faecimaris]QGX98122.1 EF-hand domain-containing protein [Roseovarius faecimaris]